MASFIQLPPEECRLYIEQAANELGRQAHMVEKDFWVCWTLERIFAIPDLAAYIVFKGGTSLSKIYRAIERFSEDIDLSVLPERLGVPEDELEQAPSRKQTKKRSNALKRKCRDFVQSDLLDMMNVAVTDVLGPGEWLAFQDAEHPYLAFHYPSVLSAPHGYLTPYVKVEVGSLSDQRPVGQHRIQTMLSEAFPDAIEEGHAEVTVLEVERTFWEKATILHQEYHRDRSEATPLRHARHYADLANLCRHDARTVALANLDLLERVAYHKKRFFRAAWASYDTARPGTLRLIPPDFRVDEIRRDYAAMRDMYYGTPLTLDEVFTEIRSLEEEVNA